MNQNPYAPPIDDMPPSAGATDDDGFIEGGRGVEAGRGYQWIAGGWELVSGHVAMWILICIVYAVIAVVLSLIPVVGQLLLNLISPILTAGLLLGCRDIRASREFGIGHLFEGFRSVGGLAILGLVRLAWAALIAGVGLAFGVGGAFGGRVKLGAGGALDMAELQKIMVFALVAMVIGIPITMANYYAPALVALKGLSPGAALKNSFLGAAKNVLPFIVYSIVATLFAILAILPCGLGLLVYMPVLIASVYVGYRDIFFVDQPSSEY